MSVTRRATEPREVWRAGEVTSRLSVIVVSHRRHHEIAQCLWDLARQATTVPFEVVLMLQAYPDGAPQQLVTRFSRAFPLSVFHSEQGLGVHAARNAALVRSTGEIVAFLDDDVRVPRHWIETLMSYYGDQSVGGVGGFVQHPGNRRLATRLLRPILGLSARRYRIDWGGFHAIPWSSHPSRDQEADWLSGCNMSFRRVALEHVHGFDEGYGPYGYDDVDVGLRVRRAGWRLVSTRRLTIAHHPSEVNRASLPDLVRDEEARRVRFVTRAIGHRPAWRLRYFARFGVHLVALSLQGVARRCPTLPLHAVSGARRGLALYARGGTT
jgi:GT2 family glycosyltransferase